MLRRPAAFTLIEMLIVISIIAVLAGLLFPALAMINAQKDRAKTQSSLGTIGAAIEQFKTVNGTYPHVYNDPNAGAPKTMGQMGSVAVSDANSQSNRDKLKQNADILGLILKAHNPGEFKELVDAWKNQIFYLHSSLYTDHPDVQPHPDGFQLWSRGANGVNDPDTKFSDANETLPWGGGDDLTNWR
jgi:prepilin-type N-terminal cleavage/methylation domain-containing protein